MTGPANATTTVRGRTYAWRGEIFDSVTTILSGGIPKPALKSWGERLVAECAVEQRSAWADLEPAEAVSWLRGAPWRQTTRAAAQGSDIHAWAERWALHERVEVAELPEAQRPYAEAFADFCRDWTPEWEMTEASVYNRRWGYAGTLDALMRVRGVEGLALVDIKTGKGVFGETALQLAAYRHAEFVGLCDGSEVLMPEVAWCAVLHLTPAGYELLPVVADDDIFATFLYAAEVRAFLEGRSKEVIGAPLLPSATTLEVVS